VCSYELHEQPPAEQEQEQPPAEQER
jgi:hypothetical protein